MSNPIEISEKLAKISVFQEFGNRESAISKVQEIIHTKNFARGEVVFKEGEIGEEMYILFSGEVVINKKTLAGDDYTVARLSSQQNAFFGELALIDDDKRSATVVTTQDSIFLYITKKDFIWLGNKHPEIGLPITRAIAQILANRLRKTTSDMLTLFDALVNEIRG